LSALLLVGSGVANAEVKDGVRVQPQPAKTQGFVASETTDTYYYLYNVNAKLFFTEGNAWGTQASVGYTGLKVAFTTDAEYTSVYLFNDYSLKKNSWKLVFFDSKTAMYVDRGSQANYRWAVVKGDGTFRLQAANEENGNPGWTTEGVNDPAFEEGKFVGWDASSNSTVLNPYLEEGENHFVDWAFVSAEDYEAIAEQLTLYEASIPLKELIDKGKAIGADIAAYETVYLNEASTLEEINAAIEGAKDAIAKREQEQAQDSYANATVANPVDVTSLFIKNPSYDNNKNDGWDGDTPGFQTYTNAEFYQAVFNTHQKVTGLLEGVYTLGLQAFYRPGWGDGDGYTRYTSNDSQIYDVKMYANNTNQPIVTAYEGAGEKVGQGSETKVTTDGGDIYIPNDMNSAAGYFKAGRYNNSMVFEALTDSAVTIGLKNSKSVGGNWVIYDNWTLNYLGAGEDAYKVLADALIKTLPDYSNLGEDVVFTQTYLDNYTDAKAALSTATGKDGIKAAIKAAQESAAEIELNISLWQKYQDLCQKAKVVAANEEYNELARESLADYEMDMQDNLNARIMTNEKLQALCNQIESDIDKAIRAPKDGADVTDYLVNPDFSTNDDTGWTGRSTITDIAHSCAEAYEKKNFDFYQVVENAPLGVYEISLKGFVRNGANDAAWPAYRDNGAPEATAFVYMNQKQTPLKNCYDEKFPASYFDLSDGHIYGPTPYALLDAQGDSLRNDAGESLWVPNGMSTSQDVFDRGYYKSSAFGLVAKEGDKMQIGIKGSLGASCWAIWDDFRLTYRGFQRDIVLEVLNEEIANVEGYKQNLIGKNVRNIIDTKLTEAENAKGFEKGQDMFDALTELFTVGDTVRASQAIFAELETIYEKLDPAIKESQAAWSLIQEATNLQSEVSNNVIVVEPAAVTWTDDKAKETIAAIEQMIKDLAKPAGYADASDADPKDANWCIVNPKYADNTNEGWTSTATAAVNYNLCEVYNADFTYYQDIELSAGTYTLTAPGFYRFGSASEDYAAYNEDATQNNNLSMYVTVGSDSLFVAMPRLASAAKEYTADVKVADDKKSFDAPNGYVWVADPEANADSTQATGYIVVNNMEQAANEFASGKYAGTTITFKVPEDMTVRIGMSKDVQQSTNWCIWGAWQLTYYGKNSTKEPTETGIATAFSNGQVARTEFFSINGTRISAPRSGVVIMKQTMSDGTIKVRKVIMK
jgi:PHD/YefM family antitoxin component YafN of YafNO toxin-antitoxin module